MRRALSFWLAGVCLGAAVPVAFAQAPYAPPKTPWGDPDLQAIWSGDSAFGIPLQRPVALGTKGAHPALAPGADARRTPQGTYGNGPLNGPEDFTQVLPYECHEGNLAVLQGLGGERAEDRAVEEDRKKGIIRPRRPIQGGLSVGGQPIPESGPSGQP